MANVKVLSRRLQRTADDELAMTIARVFSRTASLKKRTKRKLTKAYTRLEQNEINGITRETKINHYVYHV